MSRRVPLLLAILLSISFGLHQSSAAQSAYGFERRVSTGNISPSPSLLGIILESSLNDRGQIVYGSDGGLFYYSGGHVVSLFGEVGTPAPGGGKFSFSYGSNLNSAGEVIFRGEVTAPGVSGLYANSKGKISLLIPDGTVASNGKSLTPQYPVANAAGDFAFLNNSDLYLYSKGVITPIAVAGQAAPGGGTFNVVSQYAINQSDQVAFTSYLASGGTGLYLASGGTVTKILATGDTFPDGSVFSFPNGVALNDAGQIAFGGIISSGLPQDGGLFLFSGGKSKVIVPIGSSLPNSGYLENVVGVSINNAGQIAFGGVTSAGLATYIVSAGNLTQVAFSGETAPDGDIFSSEGQFGVQINSAGEVLLLSSMIHHYDALYLFSAGQLTRIAGVDDPVKHAPIFEFPTPINIDASDQVLFSDSTFPGGSGLFLASPGEINRNTTFIANETTDVSTGSISFMPASAMNSSGEVAIEAFTSENYSTVQLDSGTGLNLAAGGPNTDLDPNSVLSINNSGQVAFFAYGPSGSGLYLYSDGQTDFLTPIPGFPFSLSSSAGGSLAFLLQATPPNQNGIYSYVNGTVTAVAVNGAAAPGGGNFSYFNPSPRLGPVVNDNGVVAFAAPLDVADQSGIFLSMNNTLSRVVGSGDAAPDGSTFVSVDSPSINSSGDIAFWGITSSELGIFLYSKGVITKVVASGDILRKQTVGYLDYPRLSDSGHVAFMAMLSDGRTSVFVAHRLRAGEVSQDSLRSSSAPLSPDSPLVKQLRGLNDSAMAERRRQEVVAPNTLRSVPIAQN
jgi:hypothetical protein